MMRIITRFFDNASQAHAAKHELVYRQRLSTRIVSIFASPDRLGEKLAAQGVEAATAEAYRSRMDAQGGAVVLVRAGYKPLGVANITRKVMASKSPAKMPGVSEEVYFKDPPNTKSVLPGQPLMLTRMRDPDSTNFHMANWPIPLISRRKPWKGSVFSNHARMASFPVDLLLPSDVRYGRMPFDYLVPGHKHMAKFPFAHIVPGHRYMAKFPFGHIVPGHRYMAKFPFAHIVPGHKFFAKFPFGHLVPGHRRMANWPFPLLINGKKHTNSLVPGHRYQAKFPFAHLVPGHRHMAKFPFAHIVPGHRFMAKFPFAHIVPGHRHMAKFPFAHIVPGHRHMAKFPFDHLVPGHKYMANWILPHTKASST